MEQMIGILGGVVAITATIVSAIAWVAAKTTRIQTNDTTHNLKLEEANANIKDNLHKIEITQEQLIRLEKQVILIETNMNLMTKQLEQSNILFQKLLDFLNKKGG
jgi:predicted  nucleic acid-binding Zn-ribbon protein